jgi:hypothetical protein
MTNEDFQRRVEFIINQQAQFSSDLGALQDLITRLAVAGRDRFSDHDPKIATLTNAQLASEGRISRGQHKPGEAGGCPDAPDRSPSFNR